MDKKLLQFHCRHETNVENNQIGPLSRIMRGSSCGFSFNRNVWKMFYVLGLLPGTFQNYEQYNYHYDPPGALISLFIKTSSSYNNCQRNN